MHEQYPSKVILVNTCTNIQIMRNKQMKPLYKNTNEMHFLEFLFL